MRENGLRAAAYVAVIDLHPQVADAMLDALAAAGVAAYAAPAGSRRGLMLPTQFPAGPVDRLFVDRAAYDTARTVLDEHLPAARAELEAAPPDPTGRSRSGDPAPDASAGLPSADGSVVGGGVGARAAAAADGDSSAGLAGPDRDPNRELVDDETWSRIVAAFQGGGGPEPTAGSAAAPAEPLTPAQTPTTDAADLGDQPGRSAEVRTGPGEPVVGRAGPGSVVPVRAWPEAEDLDPDDQEDPPLRRATPAQRPAGEDEDRYFPPPPPPLPTADQTTRLAWAGVVGGPTLFILALLLDWDLASWAQLVGVAGLVIGFITLVARMRDGAPDDDPDNGAVV